jgi:hypothetical protein
LAALGPLEDLIGTWEGHGFNAIWRPHFPGGSTDPFDPPYAALPPPDPADHFLMLNLTHERTEFGLVSTAVPNRGGQTQADIQLGVIHYLQQISDANSSPGLGALHFEPGLWAYAPATPATNNQATVNRMASIPHGNALLAEGIATTLAAPVIPNINILPFTIGNPGATLGNPPFLDLDLTTPIISRNDPLPLSSTDPDVPLDQIVSNPNSLLTAELTHLQNDLGINVVGTTQLTVATTAGGGQTGGGIESIPFLNAGTSAAIPSMSATFWLSKLQPQSRPNQGILLLQYSQTVLLNFATLSWPHVTVANLFKKF